MNSLLFLPDISGFTEFVQTTEISHSQHVIAELLEVLIDANTERLQLAEIEGDALFFYKEEMLSAEKLLAQIETMLTAFYSHLKLLEKNRICPCKACSSAPSLKLKIIVHCGPIEFISVKGKSKPFGKHVIEVHRLLKNKIASDEYVLLSRGLIDDIYLPKNYSTKLFSFTKGSDVYDGEVIDYEYSIVSKDNLKLRPFEFAKEVVISRNPDILLEKKFPISAAELLEIVTNYANRERWADGVDEFIFNKHEVTRNGTEHMCVINGKHLNFTAITKAGTSDKLIYGEHTLSVPIVDELHQFFIITPITMNECNLKLEQYFTVRSIFKKILFQLVIKKGFRKNIEKGMQQLMQFVNQLKN